MGDIRPPLLETRQGHTRINIYPCNAETSFYENPDLMIYKRISTSTKTEAIDITSLPLLSTPPIRIRKQTDTRPDTYLLDLFVDRANRLPEDIDLSQRIVRTTLSIFPAVAKALPDIMALATTRKDLSHLLITGHALHQKYGYAIHNPLPFFRDHLTLGGIPFSDSARSTVCQLLQRHIPAYCPQIVTLLHQELRRLLPEEACRRFDHDTAIWIAGTLSTMGLPMYLLTAEEKQDPGAPPYFSLPAPIKRTTAALKSNGGVYLFEMTNKAPLTYKEWHVDFLGLSHKDMLTERPFSPTTDAADFEESRARLAYVYHAKIGVSQNQKPG